MAVIGIGVDLVDIARFERQLSRTPRLRDRLFAPDELVQAGRPLPLRSLAGRFAAKEALVKALGDSYEFGWQDIPVLTGPERGPAFSPRGPAAERVARLGVTSISLSISHDAGLALAFVVAEG